MANHEKMWQELGLNVELHKELPRSLDKTFQQTVGIQQKRPEAMRHFDKVC